MEKLRYTTVHTCEFGVYSVRLYVYMYVFHTELLQFTSAVSLHCIYMYLNLSQPTELPWWLTGQLVEHQSRTPEVAGSNPAQGS